MVLTPTQVSPIVSTALNTPDPHVVGLLNDATFAAVHNAFLIGGSLIELKGRIQVEACNSSLDQITFDKDNSTFSANRAGQVSTSAADGGKLPLQPNAIDSLINNIVLQSTTPSLASELRNHAWTTSVMRAIFKQIVTLHIRRFPTSTTTHSIYDIPSPPQSVQDLSTYPYPHLYPLDTPFDYANVGIGSIIDAAQQNDTLSSFATDFKLYDVTRRTLNCLTLLLDEAQESLVPTIINAYQHSLVQAVLSSSPTPPPKVDFTKVDLATLGKPSPDHIKATINVLSNQIIRFIESWDSFLREGFLVDTQLLTNDPIELAIDNEIELAAYEAGRALSALSWNVSVATIPLENALTTAQEQDDTIKKVLKTKAQTTWQTAFNDRDINHIQYQITALSTTLDAAYYRVNPDLKQLNTDASLAPANVNLPSQSIQAVKNSLDYWQRTMARLCSPSQTMKPALDPSSVMDSVTNGASASTPDSSVSGTADSAGVLDWQLSKTLRAELIQQVTVWQSLILYQQGLPSFTMEIVTQRILSDFMQDLEQAAREQIQRNKTLRLAARSVIIAILTLLLLLIVAGVTRFQSFSLNGLIQSPLVIITAIGALFTPFVTSLTSRLGVFGSFLGRVGTITEEALQRGYAQILVEFNYLNHNVAITFPLIEFFLWENVAIDGKAIQNGYDFLVNVFWSGTEREDEFRRVAQAAFGPISALISAEVKTATPAPKGTRKVT